MIRKKNRKKKKKKNSNKLNGANRVFLDFDQIAGMKTFTFSEEYNPNAAILRWNANKMNIQFDVQMITFEYVYRESQVDRFGMICIQTYVLSTA